MSSLLNSKNSQQLWVKNQENYPEVIKIGDHLLKKYGQDELNRLRDILFSHKVICIYGPPAAGKDSLAALLNFLTEVPNISIGKEMRKRKDMFPEIDTGSLANSERALILMREVIRDCLDEYQAAIIAGSPRMLTEAQELKKAGYIDLVIDLKVCRFNVIWRMLKRKLRYFWRRQPQRVDDKLSLVNKRYSLYKEETGGEVLRFFDADPTTERLTIDANYSLEKTADKLIEKLLKDSATHP